MNEDGMWVALRPVLAAMGLDPMRIENVVVDGTPDVNYTHGMIELKYLDHWPLRADTLVRLERFTAFQSAWLRRRWLRGGASWLMVRVRNEVFLFSGFDAPAVRAGLTQAEFRLLALWSYQGGNWELLRRLLLRDVDALDPPLRARLLRLLGLFTQEQVASHLNVSLVQVDEAERTCTPLTNDLIDNLVC